MKNIHVLPTDKPSELYINMQGDLSKSNSLLLRLKSRNIYITSDEEIKEGDWCIDEDGLMKCTAHSGEMNHYFQKIILTTDQDLIKDGVQAIDDEFLEWFVKNPSCEEIEVERFYSMSQSTYSGIEYEIIIPKEEPKQLFTDYPITELGDEEFKEAPIRQCKLISYDNNKYCYVKVEGIEKEIKRAYIYTKHGRCGEVDCISIDEIKELMKEEPKQETLEEAALKYSRQPLLVTTKDGFIAGAKWQQEPEQFFSDDRVKTLEKSIEYLLKRQEKMYSEEEVLNFTQTMIMQYKFGNTNIEQLDLLKETLQQFKKK